LIGVGKECVCILLCKVDGVFCVCTILPTITRKGTTELTILIAVVDTSSDTESEFFRKVIGRSYIAEETIAGKGVPVLV